MQKTFMFPMAILFSFPLFAAEPKVSCELMYIKSAADGSTEVFESQSVPVSPLGEEVISNNFKMTAKVSEICAQDANICTGSYNLQLQLNKAKSESSMEVALAKRLNNSERFSTSLKVENEKAFVNCDHEKN